MVHAAENLKQLAVDLKKSLWVQNAAAEARRPAALLAFIAMPVTGPIVPLEMRPLTLWTPALLPNRGYLDVEGCFPRVCILGTGAVTAMISRRFAIAVGVDLTHLQPGMPFLTAGGKLEHPLGVTHPLTFTLNHGKFNEAKCKIPAAEIDTDAYCVLLSMHFLASVEGMVDAWGENFHYRYMYPEGKMQLTTLLATCHTPALLLVAYAFFAGLVSNSQELLDSVGADDNSVPRRI